MLFVLLAGFAAIAIRVQPVSAAGVVLGFDPPTTVTHDPESSFNVGLQITDSYRLFAFDFNITWDNSLITYNSETHETYLNAIWGLNNWALVRAEGGAGYLRYAAISLRDEFNGTGAQTLLTLRFDIVNPTTNSMKQTSLHFDMHVLANKDVGGSVDHVANDGTVEIWGKKPILSLNPTKTFFRMANETFDVAVEVSDALSVTGFISEIDYNATMLKFISGTVIYGTGTITPDEVNGKIDVSISGSPSEPTTLITITFNMSYFHIWKDEHTITGWKNIQTGTIHIQTATLTYPSGQPSLALPTGINYGGDVTCTWSPIQGDVKLDGVVDIFDLVKVANLYDKNDATYNLTGAGSDLIDIFDLVVVASNFGYHYYP
jgi:hypothetical protein